MGADVGPVNLNRLAYFVAVAETGSFTRAAQRLGIGKAVVSQQVSRLEDELRVTLLLRSTRKVQLTEAGRALQTRCAAIFAEAGSAIEEIARLKAEPQGLLRVAASDDYGSHRVAAVAARFCRAHPACRVELLLSDRHSDLIADQVDVAIRVGWLEDSSHQARRIGGFRQLAVLAPDLSADVMVPADLAGLPFIANAALKEPLHWRFQRADGAVAAVRLTPVMTTNSTPAALAAALAGGGLTVLPDFLVADDLARGRLRQVLPDWHLPAGGVFAVYPAARYRAPKVTAFVDRLAAAHRTLGGGR